MEIDEDHIDIARDTRERLVDGGLVKALLRTPGGVMGDQQEDMD